MKKFRLCTYAFSGGVAAALLGGCGGSEAPIIAPAAMPQVRALGAHPYKLRILFQFDGSDGDDPLGGLVYLDGAFYGDAALGGPSGGGVTFAVTPSGSERTLHSFGIGDDGQGPISGLAVARHELFGATIYGGSIGTGAVFAVDTSGNEKVIHNFGRGSDGQYPQSGLINLNGTLYGTTNEGGGAADYGTVYSISPNGNEKILHSFRGGHDGGSPQRDLTAFGGVIYGTTQEGGDPACTDGCGTIFSVTTAGKERVIYRFPPPARRGSDNLTPSYLVPAHGVLYGTTIFGGKRDAGTVFRSTLSGQVRIVHVFSGGRDGGHPGGLVCINGTLYGATGRGGLHNAGVIFTMSPSGREDVIYNDLPNTNGSGRFIKVGDAFYGTFGAYDGGFFRLTDRNDAP